MRLFRREVVCQEWTELITDYLEGVLPRRLVKAIELHLASCPHCSEYLGQMRRTIEISGALPVDTDVPDELLDALQRAFEDFAQLEHGATDADEDWPGEPAD
ncbi:MAG: putative transrane anti-sigma factor [Ilumatobacteraceae bacterium]|nr:putative transrane anti-sigma factor [Ilumatobacteraceae bacterium]